MTVEACGEFIKSTAPAGGYPASPLGADAHASGYLVIDGQLCGQDATHAGHHGNSGGAF